MNRKEWIIIILIWFLATCAIAFGMYFLPVIHTTTQEIQLP